MKNTIVTLLAALIFSSTAFADVKCTYNYALSKNGQLIAAIPGTNITKNPHETIKLALDEIKLSLSGDVKGIADVCNIEKIKKEPRTKYTWEHQFTLSPATKAVKEISGVDAKSEFDDAVTKAWSEVKGSEENPVYSAVCHYSCEKITPGI